MKERMDHADSEPAIWRLRLRDRPGAVERVLSVLRRRLVRLDGLSLERHGEGRLTMEMVLGIHPADGVRIRAELDGLEDVAAAEDAPTGAAVVDPSGHESG